MNDSAVATRKPVETALSKPMDVQQVTGFGEKERFEVPVTVPANFQYVIEQRKKKSVWNEDTRQREDVWFDDNKVGLTSDGYDQLNRVLGAAFFLPDEVPDEFGRMVKNPIHRDDYIYIRMGAVWYNAVGQLVSHFEDLEVNYKHVWHRARLKQPGAKLVLDDNDQPVFDEFGMPMIRMEQHVWPAKAGKSERIVTVQEQEKAAFEALMQLREMGPRYAQTVCRTRLLKVATGIKSLPLQQATQASINVVGWRDRLDPEARKAQAQTQMSALYGKRPEEKPITGEELMAIEGGGEDAIEAVAQGAIYDGPIEEGDDQTVPDGDEFNPDGE